MNEKKADRKRIGTNLIFQGHQFRKMEKQKFKFLIPVPIISASSIIIILSFSVNNGSDFVRNAFSQ